GALAAAPFGEETLLRMRHQPVFDVAARARHQLPAGVLVGHAAGRRTLRRAFAGGRALTLVRPGGRDARSRSALPLAALRRAALGRHDRSALTLLADKVGRKAAAGAARVSGAIRVRLTFAVARRAPVAVAIAQARRLGCAGVDRRVAVVAIRPLLVRVVREVEL